MHPYHNSMASIDSQKLHIYFFLFSRKVVYKGWTYIFFISSGVAASTSGTTSRRKKVFDLLAIYRTVCSSIPSILILIILHAMYISNYPYYAWNAHGKKWMGLYR